MHDRKFFRREIGVVELAVVSARGSAEPENPIARRRQYRGPYVMVVYDEIERCLLRKEIRNACRASACQSGQTGLLRFMANTPALKLSGGSKSAPTRAP